jgi:hypothetical protein
MRNEDDGILARIPSRCGVKESRANGRVKEYRYNVGSGCTCASVARKAMLAAYPQFCGDYKVEFSAKIKRKRK